MATSEWESRDSSSTDGDSNTESKKEVKHVVLQVCELYRSR